MDTKSTMCRTDETAHEVKVGETLKGISAAALEEAFGRPTTPKEWAQRTKDVDVEQKAIIKRNGITNPDYLSTGNQDKERGPIEPPQVLQIPNPEKLFSK
jgi:hypothetical protein